MTIGRRELSFGLGAPGAASAVPVAGARSRELIVASRGGADQEAIRKAWIEPFAKASGISVQEDTNPGLARIKAMVDTNSFITWDVVTADGTTLMQGVQQGLFEPLQTDEVDLSQTYPQARLPFGAQPVQLLASGDVTMALGWNGRFQAGLAEGVPIK
ncbi:MAG: hypothetical protein FJX57_22850, partial [Alphaproteobacteria bacterium]|nr:hypothetical protein [Alphaproteobacteria bacterium]